MYFPIVCTVITSIFADADRTLKAAIERGVEYLLVIVRPAFDLDFAQSLIPSITGNFRYGIHVESLYLTLQVLSGLFFVNERDAITYAHIAHLGRELQGNGSIDPVNFRLSGLDCPFGQSTNFFRGFIHFSIKIDFCVTLFRFHMLITADTFAIPFQFSVAGVEYDKGRSITFFKGQVIDSALLCRSKIDRYMLFVQVDLIAVRL